MLYSVLWHTLIFINVECLKIIRHVLQGVSLHDIELSGVRRASAALLTAEW